jgi:NAD(P)H-hydrate epimerase
MQAIDAEAIETLGIPRILLMDHAGLSLARAVRTLAPQEAPLVTICCGPGYNGGDGFAAGRHLKDWGCRVRAILAGRMDRLRQEPAAFARIVSGLGCEIRECDAREPADMTGPWLEESAVIIDALLGIGASGPVREPVATLIAKINAAGRPVVSADIPSGLHGDTGTVQGSAVRATVTAAFGLVKQGCLTGEGPAYAGRIVVDPITIPRSLLAP